MRRGIPTRYKGITFRSRLEARWAVLFDSFGWPWEYEPLDLDGYVPDFVLKFDAGHIAVEVKPETALVDLYSYAQRMVLAGWRKELLVLGAAVFEGDIIGVIGEPIGGGEVALGPARAFRCLDCGALSVLSDDHSYRCRVAGCYGGNAHVGHLERGELAEAWAKAGNRVQWRGPENDRPEAR